MKWAASGKIRSGPFEGNVSVDQVDDVDGGKDIFAKLAHIFSMKLKAQSLKHNKGIVYDSLRISYLFSNKKKMLAFQHLYVV